jgi:hypothetical protein
MIIEDQEEKLLEMGLLEDAIGQHRRRIVSARVDTDLGHHLAMLILEPVTRLITHEEAKEGMVMMIRIVTMMQ